MDPTSDVPDGNLTQYDGTMGGKEAKLSYAAYKNDKQKSGTLIAHFGHSREHTVGHKETVEIHNDKIICVVETQEGAFQIKTISSETRDRQEQPERKLAVIDATNLPPDFVNDNIISPQFPYLEHSSNAVTGEQFSYFYVVISTHSGSRQAEKFYTQIIRPLLSSGTAPERNHTTILTTSSTTITTFAQHTLLKHALAGHPQTVLLLSGDGGIVDILNALHQPSTPTTPTYLPPTIALLPFGTGNALFHSTHSSPSPSPTLGLRPFYLGTSNPLPTFTATFSPSSVLLVDEGRATSPLPHTNTAGEGILRGAVVCSWALHASIVAESDTAAYRKYGRERFGMAAKELLRPSDGEGEKGHEYWGRVRYTTTMGESSGGGGGGGGGQEQEQEKVCDGDLHSYVLVTLVSHLERGFHISPASKPLDGQLRLLRLGAPMSAEKMEGVMGRAFTDGGHVDEEGVTYEAVERVRIEIAEGEEKRWRRVCVDGMIVGVPKGGWVEVRRDRLGDRGVNIVA